MTIPEFTIPGDVRLSALTADRIYLLAAAPSNYLHGERYYRADDIQRAVNACAAYIREHLYTAAPAPLDLDIDIIL